MLVPRVLPSTGMPAVNSSLSTSVFKHVLKQVHVVESCMSTAYLKGAVVIMGAPGFGISEATLMSCYLPSSGQDPCVL